MTKADTTGLDTLEAVRKRMDAIDRELTKLLNDRAACALRVGEIKQAEPGGIRGFPPTPAGN
jgi:chorismate mutase